MTHRPLRGVTFGIALLSGLVDGAQAVASTKDGYQDYCGW